MDRSANQLLLLLARREARADGRRSGLIALVIATPIALLAAAVVLIASSIDGEPWAPVFLTVAVDPFGLVTWVFVVGLLFLVSVAAFAVGNRQSEQTYRLLRAAGADQEHVRRLAVYRSLVPGSVGVALGVIGGALAGVGLTQLEGLTPSGSGLQRIHWLSIPLGLTVPAVLSWLGVLLGAWWPTRSMQPGLSRPQGLRRAGKREPVRIGLVLTGISLAALTVASVAYNGLTPSWLPVPEIALLSVLTAAPLGLIAGLIMVLPRLLTAITARVDSGPGWLRFGLADLARNRSRAGLAAGVTLGLSTLAVMAAAGIQSDEDWYVGIDNRYVVSEATDEATSATIERVLGDTPAQRITVRTVPVRVGLSQQDRNRTWRWDDFRATVVDEDVAATLGLTETDLRQLSQGRVLLNTRSELFDRGIIGLGTLDDLPTARVGAGEGSDTPLGLLVGPELVAAADITTFGSALAYVADDQLPGSIRNDLSMVARDRSTDIAVGSTDLFDDLGSGVIVLTVIMALLAITVGTLTAVLAHHADRVTLDLVDDLGTGPLGVRLLTAAQVGLQQLLAGVIGVAVGVGLFRLVTLGDPSVPDWILPWPTMTIMALVAPVATAVLAGLLAPVRPATRRRSSPLVSTALR